MSLLALETKMSLPREHLEFTIWYLKEKGLVRQDAANNDILITSEGVDFVEVNQPDSKIVHRLLKTTPGENPPE
jgi:hypothetical protein